VKLGAFACLCVAAGLTSPPALADDTLACVQAASTGQTLRDAHKLVAARDQFRACAAQQCPAIVQTQCASWLADVERSLPTVVVAAKDAAGSDLFDVKVSVDGAPLTTRLDGSAVPLDPGPHLFHFELADGTTVDRQALVREGAKDQNVTVVLVPAASAQALPTPRPPEAPAPGPAPPTPPPPADVPSRGLGTTRVMALGVAGVGVVGLGVGTVFGVMAMQRKSDAQNGGCAGQVCPSSAAPARDDARRDATLSTVFFVGGGVLAVAGATLWFLSPGPAHGALQVGLRVQGASAALVGTW
jgi:hypothetical protein